MVQKVFDNDILLYVMAGLCGIGILVKILIQIIYNNLMKASDNMSTSKNKLMKLIKMKFEACYKLKIGVNNVDIFVDKYIYKYKSCGILLYTWENISGQILILCLLTGAVGAGLAVFYDCGKPAILSTFFIGLLSSALLIVFESFLNLPAKRNIIRVNMKDYLENKFKVRLEQEYFYPEKLELYRNEYFETKSNVEKEIEKGIEVNLDMADNMDKLKVDNKMKIKVNKHEIDGGMEDLASTKEVLDYIEPKVYIDSKSYMEGAPNTLKRTISNKNNEFDVNKFKNVKIDKKLSKTYEINKNEEEIIEDILKEFMA